MSDEFAGGFDPRMFNQVPLFRELAKVMAWEGGPVNWDLARQTADAIAAKVPQPLAIGEGPGDDLPTAVGVAELWLDTVTALGRVAGSERMLSATGWVELATTQEGLGRLVEPVASGMGAALSGQLPDELQGLSDDPAGGGIPGMPGMPGMAGMSGLLGGGGLGRAMNAMGAMMYGVQIGTVAGHLSGQLIGSYDLGVPTIDPRIVATVGGTADRFAADYDLPTTEFRYWVALREAVHRRMYAGVAWLPERLGRLIEQFAGGAEFDPGSMLEQLRSSGIDPEDPESLQRALQDPGNFEIEPTAEQRRTLEQLQALVAFVEGYAEVVVRAAAEQRLTSLARIEETMTRRRAEKGMGEQFLERLVGLDLKPSDVRAGRAFCETVIAARGQAGLDRVWVREDYLPRPDEIAEPSRWLVRMAAAEFEDPELS